tara:strand:+ start:3162 stop:4112 length:951 start_codon:yes stop_codon:yes gene_type:complete
MKILITGGCGFIGYHLTQSLLEDGYEVLVIDNINDYYNIELKYSRLEILKSHVNFSFKKIDISDNLSVKNCFKSFRPQKVVNLAALAGIRYGFDHPNEYVTPNLIGFHNIIENCRNYDIEGFIYASSSSVYGNNAIPHKINDLSFMPVSIYGATKRYNELIAFNYSHLYNMNTTGLRYFTVYGPWYRPDMALFIFISKILDGEPISVFNNGDMERDFTYIDDIIAGTRSAIDKNYKCEVFNLGNGIGTKLIDMISLIEEVLGKKAIINFEPIQLGDVIKTCADLAYPRKKIGYNPNTSIEKGVPKLIKWYKEYYHV